ncbi:hypothetical protein CRH09_08915 [Nocardia terpenica]|uniref:Carrier domain-containing protein n=2 Tax=Nocardia terpenica TaxID=455432 RepID=A0A291RG17_9NOCA|nr:hypothetical protein CRH09_08915 [Nocardia terpenica]
MSKQWRSTMVDQKEIGRGGPAVVAVRPPGTPEPAGPFELVSEVDRPRLVGVQDAFPVSQQGLGLLVHSAQHPQSAAYHDVFRYTLELDWEDMAFRRAFDTLVERHPELRSSFALAGYSEPLQVIHGQATGGLEIVDLRALDDDTAEARVCEHIEERRFHQYDLERPPIFLCGVHVRESMVDIVFSFHRAILDGRIAAGLIVDLVRCYLLEQGENVAVQPPEHASLANHVRAERQALESTETADYWRRLLADTEMTQLDGFGSHEPPSEPEFVAYRADFPAGLTDLLEHTAAEHDLPVESLLLAAHCFTLHVFSGNEIVVTGVATHGRPGLAGADLFPNTIPVRLDMSPGSWLDAARAMFRQEQASHPHRRYPLSAVRHDSRLQTAFRVIDLDALDTLHELPGVRLRNFEAWEETNLALLINVVTDPLSGRTYLRVDADGRTITQSQAELVGHTYVSILRRLVTTPHDPVDFRFLAPDRSIAPRLEPLRDVINRFAEQVALRPDAAAVVFGDSTWSYADLDRLSRAIATNLLRAGAAQGCTIGVALDRSPELIATVLGVLRAGLVCVPLDVSYPEHRLAVIVDATQPFRVIAHAQHRHVARDKSTVLTFEEVSTVGAEPVEPSSIEIDDLALILFTSGSTGRPKGVELTHRMWANYVQWQLRVPSGAPGMRTLQFAPLSFDMCFQEIFSTLCGGGSLCVVSEENRLDPVTLLRLLDRHQVERVLLPFVALQRLAEASNALGVVPSALRVIISSGEQLRITNDVRAFCAALPGVLLENQYGPTETHQVTYFSLTGDPAGFPSLPPIGRPLDGVEVQVLDASLNPVPGGATGEIFLGGDCLARGYHRAPELTDERFLPHPWRAGARLYRTGDLGRVLPTGDVVWLGRSDNQVKVRGFRIEPAEVELAVMRQAEHHPGLRGAAVVARKRDDVDVFLAAFLVGDQESVDLQDLARRLRAELSPHMVPSHLAWLDEMPFTPSGKRDDAALRAIPLEQWDFNERTAPRDEYEQTLVELFGEILGVPDLGIHDNFFAAGGTSLTAMRLVVTFEERHKVSIPVASLIETPTAEGLADRLRSQSAMLQFNPLVTLRAQGDKPPIFLVHPLGGHVLCYSKLARHLPQDQPVYALQAPGTDQGSVPLNTIPELAATYLEAIRRIQPEGPYRLGGWSFGGFVAYEMARQLRTVGQGMVDRLIVLDSFTIQRDRPADVADDSLVTFFWELVWFERNLDAIEPLPEELSTMDEKLDYIAHRAMDLGALPSWTSRATVRRLFDLFRTNWRAMINYRPEPTDIDVHVLRASGALPRSLKPIYDTLGDIHGDPANGWRHWTTGLVNVVNVPGNHHLLMDEPHVIEIAEHMTGILDSPDRTDNER